MYVYVYGCVFVCILVFMCGAYVFVCISVILESRIVFAKEPDPIWTRVRKVSKCQSIWRPTYEMIQRSVPVRAIKTRRRFGSKLVSFHVSVYSCGISLFIIVSSIYILFVSFYVTIYFILPVWLLVSLYKTSVSVHLIYVANMSIYQCHFIWWLVATIDLGLVVVYLALDLIS